MENSKLKGTREFSRDKVPMSRLTAAGVLNAVLFFQYYILPYSVLYCITESRSLCLPLSFFLLFSLFFFSPVYYFSRCAVVICRLFMRSQEFHRFFHLVPLSFLPFLPFAPYSVLFAIFLRVFSVLIFLSSVN